MLISLCSGLFKLSKMRLVGGGSRCSGTLEVLTGEGWRRVDPTSHIDVRTAGVMCEHLKCGRFINFNLSTHNDTKMTRIYLNCTLYMSVIPECTSSDLESSNTLILNCSGETFYFFKS